VDTTKDLVKKEKYLYFKRMQLKEREEEVLKVDE